MSKDAATCVQAPPPLPLGMPLRMVWLAIPTTQEENFPCLIYLSDPLRYSRLSLGPGIIPFSHNPMCKSTIKPPLARTQQTVPAAHEPYLGALVVLYGQERGLRLSDFQLELEEMLSVAS